jgi:alpha-glucosidase
VFRDWRSIAESYSPPKLLLGETWGPDLNAMAAFHGDGDELQLTFNFPFVFAPFTADGLADVVAETLAKLPAGECPVWTASNHDVSRFPARWCGGDPRKARLALMILATLPGTFVLYYGDEIAMVDTDVPPELRRDPMTPAGVGGDGRDRARTPMPWDSSPLGGFTGEGVKPWLPLGEHTGRNVETERADPASALRLCRDLLALRRTEFAGQIAAYEHLPSPPGTWIYRSGGLLVAANFTGDPVTLPGLQGEVLIATGGQPGQDGVLLPWTGMITRRS